MARGCPGNGVPDWQAEVELEGANCESLSASHLHAWQPSHKSSLESKQRVSVAPAPTPILIIAIVEK